MICIITGASRGIGRSIALQLAEDYTAKLCLVYRKNVAEAEQVAAACQDLGSEVLLHAADVSNAEQVKALVNRCMEHFGAIDVLVNNAGITADGLSMTMSDDAWLSVQNTNLNSVFYLCRAVARPMMRRKGGRIINLSSISARRPNRGQVNYAASKGAVEAFTRALAVELAGKSITVNAVAPGVIETDMSETLRKMAGDEIKKTIPAKRFGRPEDVAHLVSFIAGPHSAYITGQVIGVDGGIGL